ncbi:MAG: BON domain-containing protein [Pirellulaceae bacterium]|nr:BON domain-containing protein [Pirellulaceae bacterium]
MLESDGLTLAVVLRNQENRLTTEEPRVQADAQAHLTMSGYTELRRVICEFHEGVLTLRGQVSTFYAKQLAQERVRTVDGVEEIDNRLEVAALPCPS